MPRKSRVGCVAVAWVKKSPLPEPTSISSGACRPNSALLLHGTGTSASDKSQPVTSKVGSTLGSARRPMLRIAGFPGQHVDWNGNSLDDSVNHDPLANDSLELTDDHAAASGFQ